MRLISSGLSDVGLQREHNEDSFCVMPDYELYLVADGMGGHRAGDVASSMATHEIAAFFKATAAEDMTWPFHYDAKLSVEENRLLAGIKLANRKIFEASIRNQEVHGMGTTVVGMVFSKDKKRMYVAHVGDSRAYRVRNGEMQALTRDHSLLNDYLMVMPDMPQEQRDELPKNVITRALGMQDTVLIDTLAEQPHVGDRYVLCSDGLSGMVPDEEIRDVIVESGDDVERCARNLIARANSKGGEDNVTVIVLAIAE